MKKCPNCGHELSDDAKVCNNCGEAVEIVDNDRSENKAKPENTQPIDGTPNQSEAQELDGKDEDLVHEHLEPGLNIEGQKEIEKEDQTDPQNKEAEDNIEEENDEDENGLANKSFLDY